MQKIKILIIRFSSIGDLVLVSPVIRCLKQQLPDSEIHLCTKASYAEMWEANPYIDQLMLLHNDLKALSQKLQQESYDYVIDLHKNLRSRRLRFGLGGKHFTYSKLNWKRFYYIWFKQKAGSIPHVVERYFRAVAPLGIKPDQQWVDYFIPPHHEVSPTELLPNTHHEGYIAYVIGASAPTKQLPVHKMAELCLMLKRPIVLVGGKEDVATAKELLEQLRHQTDAPPVINLAGSLGINQSASVVRQALAVIGHDTGLTHIAAAFHATVYTLWGCTVPYFGFTPYTAYPVNIENTDLKCRPCSRAGATKCPQGHFKCMNEIDFSPLKHLTANK